MFIIMSFKELVKNISSQFKYLVEEARFNTDLMDKVLWYHGEYCDGTNSGDWDGGVLFLGLDGYYHYVWGGCDNTGWDCQSHADVDFTKAKENLEILVPETHRENNLMAWNCLKLTLGI